MSCKYIHVNTLKTYVFITDLKTSLRSGLAIHGSESCSLRFQPDKGLEKSSDLAGGHVANWTWTHVIPWRNSAYKPTKPTKTIPTAGSLTWVPPGQPPPRRGAPDEGRGPSNDRGQAYQPPKRRYRMTEVTGAATTYHRQRIFKLHRQRPESRCPPSPSSTTARPAEGSTTGQGIREVTWPRRRSRSKLDMKTHVTPS
jgi:hypothetical protein